MAEAPAIRQGGASSGWEQTRRWALTAIAGLALAACQVVPKGPPKTVDTPPPPSEAPPPSTTPLPTDVARHRIALLVPLTGPSAALGESIANAANMAVLDTGGKSIRITTYDTGTGAAAAAQRAVADGNRLILGPLLAEEVRAVAPIGRSAKIPLLSFSNDIAVAGNGTYLLGFIPTQSIDRIVSHARSRGISNFAGLVPTGQFGQRASQAMIRAVESNGGRLVGLQTYDRSAGAISAAVAKLSTTSPYEALMIADAGRVALQIIPLVRKRPGGAGIRILGTDRWNVEGSLAQNAAMHGAWFASVSDGFYNQLAGKYRTKFGKGPYRLASLGYDSVLLVNKIAASWKVGTAFPVAQLLDSGGFSGVDGAFRFTAGGIAERMLEVQEIRPTGFTIVSPAPRSFGK